MTNEIFPHPHDDESAEDPFTGPAEPFSDQSLGASPLNPVAAARQPKRRLAIFAIAGSVTIIALFFLLSSRGNDATLEQVITTGQVDETAQAEVPTNPSAEDIDALGANSRTNPYDGPDAQQADLLDPSRLGQTPSIDDLTDTVTSPVIPDPVTSNVIPGLPDPSLAPEYGTGYGYAQPTQDDPRPGAMTEDELDLQARLDAQREAAEAARAEAEARAAAIKAEEERLRGAQTMIAEASGLMTAGGNAAAPGSSRFGLDGPAASPDVPSESDLVSSAETQEMTPGSRVTAVLSSEFVSDAQGGGRVEARLSEPLRSNGRVVLPAGTRAFGMASATVPGVAQDARVNVSFNIFVTPSGDVIRNLTGIAADPETLAMSVPGKVDNRYMERIARGALSTAVDLALARETSDRRSVFEAPSVRDMAIQDARQRAGAIINGQIGNENAVPPAVKLEPGTKLILVFGL